jgi:hypothetical protein
VLDPIVRVVPVIDSKTGAVEKEVIGVVEPAELYKPYSKQYPAASPAGYVETNELAREICLYGVSKL